MKRIKEKAARLAARVHEKAWLLACALGLCLALILSDFAAFATSCETVRADTLRLHILANSDSETDQTLKLAVRDAILEEAGTLFAAGGTKAEALAAAEAALPALRRIAVRTLRAHGCADPVTVRLESIYFSTKEYDGFTLPAGQYDALRVEIGAHEGHNWFCVLYPPLCLPAATQEDGAGYTEEEDAAIHCPYKIRFAAIELLEAFKEKFRKV